MSKQHLPQKSFFTEREWLHKAYPGYPLLISLQAYCAVAAANQRFAFLQEWHGGFYIEGLLWDWVWDVAGLVNTRQYLLNKGSEFLQTLFTQHDDAFKTLWAKTDELESLDLAAVSANERLRHFTELFDLMKDQASVGYLADCSLSTGAVDWLGDIIARELKEKGFADADIPNAIALLTGSVFTSMQTQAHNALEAIATAPETERDALIDEYIKKWHWVNNNYEEVSRPTKEDVLRVILKAKPEGSHPSLKKRDSRQSRVRLRLTSAQNDKEKFYQTHATSQKTRDAVRIAELLSEIQDKRKSCVLKTNPLLWTMSAIVANEIGIDHILFLRMSTLEFLDVLAGKKPEITELKRRSIRALFWYSKEGEMIWSGPELKNFSPDRFSNIGTITELKGVSACPGQASGIARVIMTTQDLRDFKEGEIMIANQTTPEFTPYMKKAAGIVTEQGGLTAHAAVFSREFNIPCVIGCGYATKWIASGDVIEVDAVNGIVRKPA